MTTPGTPTDLAEVEIARLCQAVEAGRLGCAAALWRAVALGAELERMEAMQRACEEYSRARQARIDAFALERGRTPSRPPGGTGGQG